MLHGRTANLPSKRIHAFALPSCARLCAYGTVASEGKHRVFSDDEPRRCEDLDTPGSPVHAGRRPRRPCPALQLQNATVRSPPIESPAQFTKSSFLPGAIPAGHVLVGLFL